MSDKKFPNGFNSWQETHFEIVEAIIKNEESSERIKKINSESGRGGLYELAEELTDKLEKKYEHHLWDGDFFDCVETFIETELK
jgi:hypothetical protein